MAMGTRKHRERQEDLWITHAELATAPGHPFYQRLNELLEQEQFDAFAERECAPFYADRNGRPSLTPGTYFRLLPIGYFEGIDSERGIAWRAADSLGLRQFLQIGLDERTPDHSTLSRTRRSIDVETHRKVFGWVLGVLADRGLLPGKMVGVDATTLEANAAMRSIVRRDNGQRYEAFLTELAQQSGIATPSREDLARLDRKRKKKGSNQEWRSASDPDARIAKMKDGSTHLAHKAEHAVAMASGAVIAVTLQAADQGDTATLRETLADAGQTVAALTRAGVRSYLPEPQRERRRWQGKAEEQQAVYANRRRSKGHHGRPLLKRRGELVERSFAHCYETGGMRRTHLRGRENIFKRQLIHVCAFNLSLIFRLRLGAGTPRELRTRQATLISAFLWPLMALLTLEQAKGGYPTGLGCSGATSNAGSRPPVGIRRRQNFRGYTTGS